MLELLEVTNPAIKKKREKEKEEETVRKRDESANKLYEKLILDEQDERFEENISRIRGVPRSKGESSKRLEGDSKPSGKRPHPTPNYGGAAEQSGFSGFVIDNQGKRPRSKSNSLLKAVESEERRELLQDEEEELKRLESIAFRRGADILEKLNERQSSESSAAKHPETLTTKVSLVREGESESAEEDDKQIATRAAWTDPDDIQPVVSVIRQNRIPRGALDTDTHKEALEKKFNLIHTTPKWVQNALGKNKTKKRDKKLTKADPEEEETSSDDDVELDQIAGDRLAEVKGLIPDIIPNRKLVPLNVNRIKKVGITFAG